MSAQIPDKLNYIFKEYDIIALSQPIGFHPLLYGMEPVPATMNCWRGFRCCYSVERGDLLLKDLHINAELYPMINGVSAQELLEDGAHHVYKDLNLLCDYTGMILAGADFLGDYFIPMGFQRPWGYVEVKQLKFENGKLTDVFDQSWKVEEMRRTRAHARLGAQGDANDPKFVSECFSLAVDKKAAWIK